MLLSGVVLGIAQAESSTAAAEKTLRPAPEQPLPTIVPSIPFDDNPDPEACGIPRPWASDTGGIVDGHYQGELIQPVVYLYDSHLRHEVVGQIPSGSDVEILLYQSNPVLDYYLIRSADLEPAQEGWVPAPFLIVD